MASNAWPWLTVRRGLPDDTVLLIGVIHGGCASSSAAIYTDCVTVTPAPSLSPSSYASDSLFAVSVVEYQVVRGCVLQRMHGGFGDTEGCKATILKFTCAGTVLSTSFWCIHSWNAAPELERSYRFFARLCNVLNVAIMAGFFWFLCLPLACQLCILCQVCCVCLPDPACLSPNKSVISINSLFTNTWIPLPVASRTQLWANVTLPLTWKHIKFIIFVCRDTFMPQNVFITHFHWCTW